jgi:endonuclease III
MIQLLHQFYGRQAWPPSDLFQFLVWDVIADNALPARRDLAWHALRRLPALTPDALYRTPTPDLLAAVSMAGPHAEQRMERLRMIAAGFRRRRGALRLGSDTRALLFATVRFLCHLEQVPRHLRARAVLFTTDTPVLPIDAEIQRVVSRLMGSSTFRRRLVKQWLSSKVPRDIAAHRDAVVYLRHHAMHTCVTVAPHCGVCPLRSDCRSCHLR